MKLDELLPVGSTRRTIALVLAVVAGVLVFTQLVLPGNGPAPQGTPAAILFRGAVVGMVTALTAAGLILVYRTLRIVNFAQTAVGAAGATLVFELARYTPVPFPLAFLGGVVLGALAGLIFDLLFGRRFFNAPRLVLTVVTIAAASFFAASSEIVRRLPFFPPVDSRDLAEIWGIEDLRAVLPFRGLNFRVGSLPLDFGFPELFALEVALITLLALGAFFRFTKSGVAIRAMAENTERASLLGVNVGTLSTVVWVIAGALSAISVTLTGVLTQPAAATGIAPAVLLPALAAAVIGGMRSFPVTVAAAVGLSVLSQATEWSIAEGDDLVRVGLFVVIAASLLVQRRRRGRSEAGVELSWEATKEHRAVPRELRNVPSVRYSRWALAVVGLVFVLAYPYAASAGAINVGGLIALNAITVLSLVVLTGWAGQVSLGQLAFVAVGAVAAGTLSNTGVPFWFAVPIGAAAAGAVAVLVGLPALRIRGLFLGITTFAFAMAVNSLLSSPDHFGNPLPRNVERPSLFFLDFDDERSMYYLCVAGLVLAIVVVTNLRRSRTGRVLIGSRENEANLQSFGVNAVRAKLLAFAVSGTLAGFSGALFIHHQRGLTAEVFPASGSVELFVYAVIGGIGSVGGALLGASYGELIDYFLADSQLLISLAAFIPLIILYAAPGGAVSLLVQVRDAMLRIVAQRRQLVVPSLFADYDPEALARRLVVLAEPLDGGGLAALAPDQRFTLSSQLYAGHGERLVDKVAGAKPTDEAAAIAAAAEASR
ncbi:MAG: ABC transporter permease [Actinobacteria bacterium]|nr:ABC transporter permease [Actinomycetota bacterium]